MLMLNIKKNKINQLIIITNNHNTNKIGYKIWFSFTLYYTQSH